MNQLVSGLIIGVTISSICFLLFSKRELTIKNSTTQIQDENLPPKESTVNFSTESCPPITSDSTSLEKQNRTLIAKLKVCQSRLNNSQLNSKKEGPQVANILLNFSKYRETEVIKYHLGEELTAKLSQKIKSSTEAWKFRTKHTEEGFNDNRSFKIISKEDFKNHLNGLYEGVYLKIERDSKNTIIKVQKLKANLSIEFYIPDESTNSKYRITIEVPKLINSSHFSDENKLISSTTDGRLIINIGESNFFEELEPNSLKFNHYSSDKLQGFLIINSSRR